MVTLHGNRRLHCSTLRSLVGTEADMAPSPINCHVPPLKLSVTAFVKRAPLKRAEDFLSQERASRRPRHFGWEELYPPFSRGVNHACLICPQHRAISTCATLVAGLARVSRPGARTLSTATRGVGEHLPSNQCPGRAPL